MLFQRISQNYGLLRSRETGEILSMAPNFDMLPASENIDTMFAETFDAGLRGIDPDRAKLYRICEENDVGITVMKGFAGGRLFDEKRSPFGGVQCSALLRADASGCQRHHVRLRHQRAG